MPYVRMNCVAAVIACALFSACQRETTTMPAVTPPSDEPSRFLARLVSDLKEERLKSRLQARFPKIKVGFSDGLKLASGARYTMVQCVFPDSRELDAEGGAVLDELQAYLTEIAQATDAQTSELVVERSPEGKPQSFALVYRSPTGSGRVKAEIDRGTSSPVWGVYLNLYE